ASGSPRDQAGYDAIHDRVEAFARRIRPVIEVQGTPFKKGLRLHQAMHAEFFGGGSAAAGTSPAADGYDFEQSALAPIFATRRYNCVSSAILFTVLALRFGLEPEGVLLPSHVFVQIRNPGAKAIEVETTSPQGYALMHDRAFYETRASRWFRAYGLAPSTYADYERRTILSPLELVAHNMNHQHTAPSRMSQLDRCRLMEARAYLDPGGADAQWNRVVVYHAEAVNLKEEEDFAAVAALFAKVLPEASAAGRRFPDPALRNRIGWLWYEHAAAVQRLGRGAEALALVDTALTWVDLGEKGGTPLRGNCMALIQMEVGALGQAGRFAEGEALLDRYPAFAREEEGFRRARAWLYGTWAMALWKREDWPGAAARLEALLAVAPEADHAAIRGNLAGAYLHWSQGLQQQGDLLKARETLNRCIERMPEAAGCRAQLANLLAAQPR
ncbi:MAG TPA: transglutaminase family protein, partial [Fibrobacteria bacterium]|nr:transglutaminase family protein [Fibrobacteria bacterium]